MGDYKKGKRIVYIIAIISFIFTIIYNYFLKLNVPGGDFTNAILKFGFKGFTMNAIISTVITLVIYYFLCKGNSKVKDILTGMMIIGMFFMLLEALNGIEYRNFRLGNGFALFEFLMSLVIVLELTKNKDVKCFFDKNKKRTAGTYKM